MNFKFGTAGFLFASTLIVNAGNYLINLILGRILGPELFAEASVIATAVLMLSFFAVGIQLSSAKFSAEYFAANENKLIAGFEKWIGNKVLIISLVLATLLILGSRALQGYLHFHSFWPIIIIAIGIPMYFNMSVKRGIAQGTDNFIRLAWTYIIEMLLRLVFTFGLIFLALKSTNQVTSEAVSAGFLFSFLAAMWVKPTASQTKDLIPFSGQDAVKSFVFVILIYEFSQILINNSDVILAKHFFTAEQAGLYAAIALIGRVVFFGTWTIVTLLFPKVIQREKQGLPHFSLFWLSFSITAGFGLIVILACYFVPELIIGVLFGPEYLEVSALLWKYALATSLFASANVFAYYYMSLSKYTPVVLSVIAGVMQVALIYVYHNSLSEVIQIQIYVMGGLLLSMIAYQILQSISSSKKIRLNAT